MDIHIWISIWNNNIGREEFANASDEREVLGLVSRPAGRSMGFDAVQVRAYRRGFLARVLLRRAHRHSSGTCGCGRTTPPSRSSLAFARSSRYRHDDRHDRPDDDSRGSPENPPNLLRRFPGPKSIVFFLYFFQICSYIDIISNINHHVLAPGPLKP